MLHNPLPKSKPSPTLKPRTFNGSSKHLLLPTPPSPCLIKEGSQAELVLTLILVGVCFLGFMYALFTGGIQ